MIGIVEEIFQRMLVVNLGLVSTTLPYDTI